MTRRFLGFDISEASPGSPYEAELKRDILWAWLLVALVVAVIVCHFLKVLHA